VPPSRLPLFPSRPRRSLRVHRRCGRASGDAHAQHQQDDHVGIEPWHGLGVRLPANATYRQIAELAGFYTAKEKQLFIEDSNLVVPDKKAVLRGDDGRYLTTVGSGYRVVQFAEVAKSLVEATGLVGGFFHTAETLGPVGARGWLLGELPGDIVVKGDPSPIKKYLLGTTGHDGLSAINLKNVPTMEVSRSNDNDTTKGGHADLLPIADDLLPYLRRALDTSTSELVFPDAEGQQQRHDVKLQKVLRKAMARAGIVSFFMHICRKKKCGFKERRPNAVESQCPKCSKVLFVKGVARPVRFHDLRHTTATLLLKAEVPLATVQRVLRHTDPAITSEIYGHLDLDDMRKAVNKLSFNRPDGRPVKDRLRGAAKLAPLFEAAL
jgi:predicted Zn-ribbon and HTH transcriptional regulator